MGAILGFLAPAILAVLKSYLQKLGTKEVVHYVFMEIGQAVVDSTKNEKDDEWFGKLRGILD